MAAFCQRIAHASWFKQGVTSLILFAGVLVGCETYPRIVDQWGRELALLNDIILWIFVVEIVVKMVAEGSRPWRFFYNGWNVFDFVIVGAAFVPGVGQFAVTLRLLRLLRVLKLLSALPRLQVLVSALLKSIPSMFSVALLLSILFYVYAVAAVFLFRENDPVHFRSLEMSFLSLFRVVTLEDWTDVMYIQMYGSDVYGYTAEDLAKYAAVMKPEAQPVLGALFFVSFVMLGTMVVLNLFIGVIMTGMDQAQEEQEAAMLLARAGGVPQEDGDDESPLDSELGFLQAQISALEIRKRQLLQSGSGATRGQPRGDDI